MNVIHAQARPRTGLCAFSEDPGLSGAAPRHGTKTIAATGLSTRGRLFSRGPLKRGSVEHARYERSPFVQSPLITGSPPLPKDLPSRRPPCTRQAAEPLPAHRRTRHIARGEKDTHPRSSRPLPIVGEVETPLHRSQDAIGPLSPERSLDASPIPSTLHQTC